MDAQISESKSGPAADLSRSDAPVSRGVFARTLSQLYGDRLAMIGLGIIGLFVFIAIFGPLLAPYDPNVRLSGPDGSLAFLEPPSATYPLGTTDAGRDIFSQLLVGARAALIIGGIAALAECGIGVLLGLISGYYRGVADTVIMRAVDVAYALPLEPMAIVLLVFVGQSIWTIILAIVLLSWRSAARVIRTQVLSVSQRTFVHGAKAIGSSNSRILRKEILPNILPIAVVYLPVGFGNAVVAEASISFLGFGDPNIMTWGRMLHDVFTAGATQATWWWVLAPGVCITAVVASVFFVTRAFEDVLNPRLSAAKR